MRKGIEIQVRKPHSERQTVSRENDQHHRREYLMTTVMAASFIFVLLFYAWQHYQWIQYGYRIEEAQKTREALTETSRRLRLDRAELRNPQRIDRIARTNLGMVVAAPGQVVTLSPDAPLTIPAQDPVQHAQVAKP